jgi:hypothetical protein
VGLRVRIEKNYSTNTTAQQARELAVFSIHNSLFTADSKIIFVAYRSTVLLTRLSVRVYLTKRQISIENTGEIFFHHKPELTGRQWV